MFSASDSVKSSVSQVELTKPANIGKLESSGFGGSLVKVPNTLFAQQGSDGIPAAKGWRSWAVYRSTWNFRLP